MCLSALPSKSSMLMMPMVGSLIYNPSMKETSCISSADTTSAVLSAMQERLRSEQRRTKERLSRLHEQRREEVLIGSSEQDTTSLSVTDTVVSALKKQVQTLKNLLQAKSDECQRLEARILESQKTKPTLERRQEQHESAVANQVLQVKSEWVNVEPSVCDGVIPFRLMGHTRSSHGLSQPTNAHSWDYYQSIIFSAPESVVYCSLTNQNNLVLGSAQFSDFSVCVSMATPRTINRFVNLAVPRLPSFLCHSAILTSSSTSYLIKAPADLVSIALSANTAEYTADDEKTIRTPTKEHSEDVSVARNFGWLRAVQAIPNRLFVLGEGYHPSLLEKVHLMETVE